MRLLKKTKPTIVVVGGSVGKTTTTQAIATVLSKKYAVTSTISNYNTDVGVPCSLFGRKFPSNLRNPFAWLVIFLMNEVTLLRPKKMEVVVLELGTDTPGEMQWFEWLNADIGVLTGIQYEHMENFSSLDDLAKEEMQIANYSEQLYVNKHTVDRGYLKFAGEIDLFNYSRDDISGTIKQQAHVIGDHSFDAFAAAQVVARQLEMNQSDIDAALKELRPQPGRMNRLRGLKESTLIDDTYNAAPAAMQAALEYLQSVDADHRIALLGNMNELGDISAEEHTKIGQMCDPKKLDFVVTLGPDANEYIAPAAQEKGCLVATTTSPVQAAELIKKELKPNSAVLLKGSQNKVYAEEATKQLLANSTDVTHLVRQSPEWMKIKTAQFPEIGRR